MVLGSLVAGPGLSYFLHNPWFLVAPVPIWLLCGWHQAFRIPCPECSRRLQRRTVVLPETKGGEQNHRILFDCRHCRTTWDPHIVVTSSTDTL